VLENLQVIATKTILKHLGILSPSEQMPLKRDLALKTQRPQISDRNSTPLGDRTQRVISCSKRFVIALEELTLSSPTFLNLEI
jgi:hypothetical protein